MSDQMIFKRYEMKYLLNRTQYRQITEAFDGRMKPDIHGKNTILSLYFDTPDDLLIRRSLEKPLYKEKLRVRSYGIADTDTTVFVELKKKYQSVVYKRRIAMSEEEARRYLLSHASVMDTQISREIDYCLFHYHNLIPRMLLSYTPAKSYNSVVISCPKLTSGETYTLLAGDTTTTVTLDSLVKSVKK